MLPKFNIFSTQIVRKLCIQNMGMGDFRICSEFDIYIYSKTSMTRTPMAHLSRMVRTRFLNPNKILQIAQENKLIDCVRV